MVSNKLKKQLFIEAILIMVASTILHFIYDMSNSNTFIAAFVPVNESVWEHLKLPTTATILYFIISYFKMKEYRNYKLSVFLQVLSQIFGILFIYYTYKAIFKKELVIIDVLGLYISVILSVILKYNIITKVKEIKPLNIISMFMIFFIAVVFVIFTYVPPKLNIFKDEVEGTYGIFKEGENNV